MKPNPSPDHARSLLSPAGRARPEAVARLSLRVEDRGAKRMTPGRYPKNISGLWWGTYDCDREGERPPDGGSVEFELRISQNWLQRMRGTFTGSITEDPKRGVPEIATVKGRRSRAALSFTKLLPILRIAWNGKSITLAEFYQRNGYAERAPRVAHPPIFYTGIFTSESEAAGTWLVEEGSIPFARRQRLPILRSTGTFTLSR